MTAWRALRKQVLEELEPQFEAEGNTFTWENRMGDGRGISRAAQEGLQARYLYRVRLGDAPG